MARPRTYSPLPRKVSNRAEMLHWASHAKSGDRVMYFLGELARFKAWVPLRIALLQRRADNARPSRPRPPSEAMEVERLLATIELIATVTRIAEGGMVHLTQQRTQKRKIAYIAVRIR